MFGAPQAGAATGSVLADIAPTGVLGGVGVAFDGHYLYTTDRDGIVLHRTAPNGAAAGDIPILGSVPINALTYDATRDMFWGVDATGLNVYRVEKDGYAGLQFTLLPLFDLPGGCNVLGGCSTLVSGLAYDATDDTLWYLPQGSQRVYHVNTAGQYLGFFDNGLAPTCASNAASGISAGAGSLFLTAAGCASGFRLPKADAGTPTPQSSFAVAAAQPGGSACDSTTFAGLTALWVRDAASGHVRAIELPSGSCIQGGGIALVQTIDWMSGGGSAGPLDPSTGLPEFGIQHAFHLSCSAAGSGSPNNLVANWTQPDGTRYSFHLKSVTIDGCVSDGTDPAPPASTFNTIFGHGSGTLVGRSANGTIVFGSPKCNGCGLIEFRFTDRGEPNTLDDGNITIEDANGFPIVFEACGCIRANYQAHQHA
jgi:hypothetical protein